VNTWKRLEMEWAKQAEAITKSCQPVRTAEKPVDFIG
jgi:hypothetical protein